MSTHEALNVGAFLALAGAVFYLSLVHYMTRR